MGEGESHPRNESCKEEFKRFDEYMRTGMSFREKVAKHEQQLIFQERISMELKESIANLDKKVDERLLSVNSTLLDLTTNINKIAIAVAGSSKSEAKVDTKLDDLDKRLKNMELWRWFVAGGFAVIIFLLEKFIR
jgi:archaellum component FlaC